jgi:hypothetical protein
VPSMRIRWITTICDLIRPRGKSLGGVTLTAAILYWIPVEHFKWEGDNVIHVLGLEFDEEHNGEVRFQISFFLRSYKHLHVPCLPLYKVLNVGPLLCPSDDISPDILIRVMNNWVDRLHRCLAQKGAHIDHLI